MGYLGLRGINAELFSMPRAQFRTIGLFKSN
jgi:hypothetical protein